MRETYLGDGVYVTVDQFRGSIRLRAPREGGDHLIYLDHRTLDTFLTWLADVRKTLLTQGEPQ